VARDAHFTVLSKTTRERGEKKNEKKKKREGGRADAEQEKVARTWRSPTKNTTKSGNEATQKSELTKS